MVYSIDNNSKTRGIYVNRFSTFKKVIRVTAYLSCFFKLSLLSAPLTATKLDKALQCLIFFEQHKCFGHESNKSKVLLSLNPFVDSNKLVRVRECLTNSSLTFKARHRIILPASCCEFADSSHLYDIFPW